MRATRRARIVALTSGGAIPDNADYRVLQEPDETYVGSINEDFAVESNAGDIFQLGNTSWRILRIEQGRVLVSDARGEPPTIPFWFGEAPARSAEASAAVSALRVRVGRQADVSATEARETIRAFKAMMSIHEHKLEGEENDADALATGIEGVRLGDLEALQGVVKFPVRIKCATLAWNTLQQGLEDDPAE